MLSRSYLVLQEGLLRPSLPPDALNTHRVCYALLQGPVGAFFLANSCTWKLHFGWKSPVGGITPCRGIGQGLGHDPSGKVWGHRWIPKASPRDEVWQPVCEDRSGKGGKSSPRSTSLNDSDCALLPTLCLLVSSDSQNILPSSLLSRPSLSLRSPPPYLYSPVPWAHRPYARPEKTTMWVSPGFSKSWSSASKWSRRWLYSFQSTWRLARIWVSGKIRGRCLCNSKARLPWHQLAKVDTLRGQGLEVPRVLAGNVFGWFAAKLFMFLCHACNACT